MNSPTRLLSITCVLSLALGCAESMRTSSDEAYTSSEAGTAMDAEAPGAADDGDNSAPPEQEDDFLALRPAQTDIYVFIANPTRHTVTRVNVHTLAVDTTEVGANPTEVLTTPDYTTAVVFNEDDDSVTILDADTLDSFTVVVRPNMNRMVLSPGGEWAVLWHDVDAEDPEDDNGGLVSYNEVSFIHVATGDFYPMAVGPYPHGVEFTPQEDLAVVVSDESLALVDLTADDLQPDMVQIVDDLLDPPPAEEVVVAPDGTYAFVRQFGAEELVIVDLLTQEVGTVDAGSNPTDLDLTPSGGHAVVVARDSNELWLYDVADPFAPAEILSLPAEQTSGSIVFDPTGTSAVLYSTAILQDRYATWDLTTDEIEVRPLEKPIETLSVSPTGDTLLVFHTVEDATDADPASPFYGEPALTMINLVDFRTTPILMPSTVSGYVNSSNGHFGYFIMESEPILGVLDYALLMADQIDLTSNPVYVGVIPDLDSADADEPPAWISQEHELGRISFYDPDDESVETITGFELNSQIEQ